MKNVRCCGWGGAGEPINVRPPSSSQPRAMLCSAPEPPQMSCLFLCQRGGGTVGSCFCPNKHFGHARVSV